MKRISSNFKLKNNYKRKKNDIYKLHTVLPFNGNSTVLLITILPTPEEQNFTHSVTYNPSQILDSELVVINNGVSIPPGVRVRFR